jgi:hypothetical protein
MPDKTQPQTNGNGTPKWLGVPIVMWVELAKVFGTSGVILIGLLVIAQQCVPDLVAGHLEFLRTTSQAVIELKQPMQSLEQSADEMGQAARELKSQQKETSEFFGQAQRDHAAQAEREEQMLDDHKRVIQALTEIKTTTVGGG